VRSVVGAFSALKDTKTPVAVAAFCLLVNVGAALLMMGPWGHVGLALATSLAGGVNLAGLLWLLRRKLGRLGGRAIARSALGAAGASAVMGLAAWLVVHLPDWGPPGQWAWRTARPLAAVLAGGVVYLGCARLLRLPELGELGRVLRRKTS
jgi:putative peptidoglycan lipid II flippase